MNYWRKFSIYIAIRSIPYFTLKKIRRKIHVLYLIRIMQPHTKAIIKTIARIPIFTIFKILVYLPFQEWEIPNAFIQLLKVVTIREKLRRIVLLDPYI